eukprot:gb/GECH01000880.1/.p1 GENE.gb/GECH01000880.1/~~gb/GECH01000880.1/.p1  ORF type:complete len:265 (+),score=77.06 gb/GECH01000880.1/:1-795(+)
MADDSSMAGTHIDIIDTVKETDPDTKKPFTMYVIEIQEDGKRWTVKRRYREFSQFNQELGKKYTRKKLPKMPPKQLFGNMSQYNIHKRRIGLKLYLRELMADEELFDCSEVRRFLNIDQHIIPETPRFSLNLRGVLKAVLARYNYEADDDEEMSFKKGEVIQVIQEDPSGWWFGFIGNRDGFFPSNFVEPVTQEYLKKIEAERLKEAADDTLKANELQEEKEQDRVANMPKQKPTVFDVFGNKAQGNDHTSNTKNNSGNGNVNT